MPKEVWAIMVELDGKWELNRPFTSDNKKTERRAREALKILRGNVIRKLRPRFKLEKILYEIQDEN